MNLCIWEKYERTGFLKRGGAPVKKPTLRPVKFGAPGIFSKLPFYVIINFVGYRNLKFHLDWFKNTGVMEKFLKQGRPPNVNLTEA